MCLEFKNDHFYLITTYFHDQKAPLKPYSKNSVSDFVYPSRAECSAFKVCHAPSMYPYFTSYIGDRM